MSADRSGSRGSRTSAVPSVPLPVDCIDLELSAAPLVGSADRSALALVRVHGCPVGSLLVDVEQRTADGGRAAALRAFGDAVDAHLVRDGLTRADLPGTAACRLAPSPSDALVTVVVCTTGEDPRLRATIESVLAQSYRDLELVVVDNRPSTGQVDGLLRGLDDPRLRAVAEPCRGLSAARNAGVAAARGTIVAFTDDDAVADPEWVGRLAGAFVDEPGAVAVTGLVVPSELTTAAQWWFEEFGAFDKGHTRTWWSMADGPDAAGGCRPGERGPLFPYAAGVYGSGNNMAFRADWLRGSGLFDEALGAGSLARGGEDLDAFLTVMLSRSALLYEPAAVVRHAARRSMPALATQLYGYGSGNSAAIARQLLRSPASAMAVLIRVPAGVRRLLDPRSEKNRGRTPDYPAPLARVELRGFVLGPLLYLRGRREARARRRRYPLARTPQAPPRVAAAEEQG